MDRFKKNPFLGAVALLTAVAGAIALYFAASASGELASRQEEYAASTGALRRMQDAQPFPDQANAALAAEEAGLAGRLLEEISAVLGDQAAPVDTALTPRIFQDQLSSAADALEEAARQNGVSLPADFYLGFEQYRAAPPPAAAAPLLAQQLQNMSNVFSLLVKARVVSIDSVARRALPGEEAAADAKDPAENEAEPALQLAPFDLEFTADHSSFQNALASVISTEPVVLVQLLAVTNSQPVAPVKETPESPDRASAAPGEEPAGIPVLFGQERVTVKMRLAALSGDQGAAKN